MNVVVGWVAAGEQEGYELAEELSAQKEKKTLLEVSPGDSRFWQMKFLSMKVRPERASRVVSSTSGLRNAMLIVCLLKFLKNCSPTYNPPTYI